MPKPRNHRVSRPALGPLRAGSEAGTARKRGPAGSETHVSARATAATVADVARRYLRLHVAVNCKPKSMDLYRTVIDNHIVLALGDRPMGAVRRSDVAALQYSLHDRPAVANSTIQVLTQLFRKAQQWGLAPEGPNPCRSIRKYKLRLRDRHLTRDEYRRLGQTLRDGEAGGWVSAPAAAALRLLILTGCRRGEILGLRWEEVDLKARELRKRAGLDDVRLHDLRHSFASSALALGESLPMIARLLGHRQIASTARYAHLARASVHEAAARVAESLAEDVL